MKEYEQIKRIFFYSFSIKMDEQYGNIIHRKQKQAVFRKTWTILELFLGTLKYRIKREIIREKA